MMQRLAATLHAHLSWFFHTWHKQPVVKLHQPVPESEIDKAHTVVERMMIRWRGEPDPAHVRAIDAYFVSAAEHGMNASTFTARVIASTGADVAAALIRCNRCDVRSTTWWCTITRTYT